METLSLRPRDRREPSALSVRVSRLVLTLIFLPVSCRALAQSLPEAGQKSNWDLSVWVAGETGEENTNSFAEAQIWSAGVFVGRVITRERGSGWRRGNLEYAFDLMPIFATRGNQRIHGAGFDPVILRWNSALHTSRVSPYIELAEEP